MEFTQVRIGEKGFIFLIGLIFFTGGLTFLIYGLKNKPPPIKISAVILLLLAGIFSTWRIEIPQERIHILEYGLLGWFAGRDLIGKTKRKRGFIFAWILTVVVGVFDEGFQKILPYRVWDIRDILFNSLGGLWGIGLYRLK